MAEPQPRSILFAVITSHSTRTRALAAFLSWCAIAENDGHWCHFFADRPFDDDPSAISSRDLGHLHPSTISWTAIMGSTPPPASSCCHDGKGFFCSAHRQRTLRAQYRYLPALALAQHAAAHLGAGGAVDEVPAGELGDAEVLAQLQHHLPPEGF